MSLDKLCNVYYGKAAMLGQNKMISVEGLIDFGEWAYRYSPVRMWVILQTRLMWSPEDLPTNILGPPGKPFLIHMLFTFNTTVIDVREYRQRLGLRDGVASIAMKQVRSYQHRSKCLDLSNSEIGRSLWTECTCFRIGPPILPLSNNILSLY